MIIRMKKWLKSMERKRNNKGSALVLTIISVAMLSFMVVVLLTITVYNSKMKSSDLKAKQTFYTAETAMDEIRVGLQQDVSVVFSETYIESLEKYASTTEDERNKQFQTDYVAKLKDRINGSNVNPDTYDIDRLKGYLKKTAFDDTKKIGAVLDIPEDENYLQIVPEGLALRNVTVMYYEANDYVSRIKTDIVLQYPAVDLGQTASSLDYLKYALIANEQLVVSQASVNINGSVYAGKNGAQFTASTVNCTTNNTDGTRMDKDLFITNENVDAYLGSTVTFSDMETWAKNLVVDSSTLQVLGSESSTYINNDIVLSGKMKDVSTNISLNGKYYGYGNLDSARACAVADVVNNVDANPSQYSSAILINGTNSNADLSGLSEMLIAGNSYIVASRKNDDLAGSGATGTDAASSDAAWTTRQKNEDIGIGESISVKRNQTAYIVPAQCVAPNAENGRQNPMTASRYQALRKELGLSTSSSGGENELIDMENVVVSDYGMNLASLGVTGCKVVCYPVQNIGSMVYLFMEFESDEKAGEFFAKYYAINKNVTKLQGNLDLYSGTDGIKLPQAMRDSSTSSSENTDANSFYYNGGLVVYDGVTNADGVPANFYVKKDLLHSTKSAQDLIREQSGWQNNFAALGINLTKNYSKLTSATKNRDVYGNLIVNLADDNGKDTDIDVGAKRSFVTEDSEGKYGAVVVNGDYTIANNKITADDAEGNKVYDADLKVVIASGDVTISTDFTGLVIAGGSVKIDDTVKLESDANSVAIALNAEAQDGVRPSAYISGGNQLMIGGVSSEDSADAQISISDTVVYENWKKQ